MDIRKRYAGEHATWKILKESVLPGYQDFAYAAELGIIRKNRKMQKRKYKKFGKNYFIQGLYFFVPLALFFCLAWTSVYKQNIIFWASIAAFITGLNGFILWDRNKLKSFHCPKCNKHISKATIVNPVSNDPINYYCDKCDIEWETGLSVPDD